VTAIDCLPSLQQDLSIVGVRAAFREWLGSQAAELAPFAHVGGGTQEVLEQLRGLQRLLYQAGWLRLGWPTWLGGLGGSLILRGLVSEELAAAGYPPPLSFAALEVLAPAVVDYGPRELADQVIPRLLSGKDLWCQGFSEPGAGSDLGAISTRAVDCGDLWRVSGQKLWTSWAAFSQRCFVLVRTGTPQSAHRGITALFVDMDTPGLSIRPFRSMTGDDEFAELFFDDVAIPKSRTIGEVNGGWKIAMAILGYERGAVAWQRQAWLHGRLRDALAVGAGHDARTAGEAFELLHALRLSSRRSLRRIAAGQLPGSDSSIDKILLSTAEQFLFDMVLGDQPAQVLFGQGPAADEWRRDILYSRAASIYGGAAELQRNIVAQRLLGLPRGA
jgi:alkylation response protein AidB-like acyl-CoA dehydrogenase